MTAVTDTGPLIVLAKLNHLHLLPTLYDRVIVPRSVYRESVLIGQTRGYRDAETIRVFLELVGWQPVKPASMPQQLASDVQLGQGELEAIALAEQNNALLLIDEVYARDVAERMGVRTAGSLGILVDAYRRGALAQNVLAELLTIIERRQDIWIHPDLCRRVRIEVLKDGK